MAILHWRFAAPFMSAEKPSRLHWRFSGLLLAGASNGIRLFDLEQAEFTRGWRNMVCQVHITLPPRSRSLSRSGVLKCPVCACFPESAAVLHPSHL